MVRKISFAILSLAILAAGLIASKKLNYLESSLWVFRLNAGQHTETITGEEISDINTQDTLKLDPYVAGQEENRRTASGGIFRKHEGMGRTYSPGSDKINLCNVVWFAAVFASFTVIAIYIDQACRFIGRKRKNNHRC